MSGATRRTLPSAFLWAQSISLSVSLLFAATPPTSPALPQVWPEFWTEAKFLEPDAAAILKGANRMLEFALIHPETLELQDPEREDFVAVEFSEPTESWRTRLSVFGLQTPGAARDVSILAHWNRPGSPQCRVLIQELGQDYCTFQIELSRQLTPEELAVQSERGSFVPDAEDLSGEPSRKPSLGSIRHLIVLTGNTDDTLLEREEFWETRNGRIPRDSLEASRLGVDRRLVTAEVQRLWSNLSDRMEALWGSLEWK